MDWHELEKKKVDELRELAKEKTALEAVSGLHKEELVEKIAEAMGIPRPHKVVEASDKGRIKQHIRELKSERDLALEEKDAERYRRLLKRLRCEKRRLRRMAHLTH